MLVAVAVNAKGRPKLLVNSSVFAQESAEVIGLRWDDLASSMYEYFPKSVALMNEAGSACWPTTAHKISPTATSPRPTGARSSTNLLVRVNYEIKRRTRVVGIFPNDAAITRMVEIVLLEQDRHWQLEGRRMFSAGSMASMPELEDIPDLHALSAWGVQHAGLW